DEQALATRRCIALDPRDRGFETLRGRRLAQERERASREPVLTIFVERDDLHRDVPRFRILLQLVEDGPAEHIRQEHIDRHRSGPLLPRYRTRIDATSRHDDFESCVAGAVDDDACVMRIVLDDEERWIAGLDVFAVVLDDFDCTLRSAGGREGDHRRRLTYRYGCA